MLVCHAAGCAFDDIMSADDSVHIKLDDDIIFIKDGSFEHLVYQVLTNKDYTFYSGSVVNNPHSYALHTFVGAMAPSSFHFKSTRQNNMPPLYNYSMAYHLYWGYVRVLIVLACVVCLPVLLLS
jgi:hypothetical protein